MELMSTRWFIISLSCGGDTFPDNSGTIHCWMALGRLIAVINTVHHRENSKVLVSDLVLGYVYFFLHDTCLQGFSQPPWLLLLHPLPHHCKIYARQHQFCDFLLWRHTAMEHMCHIGNHGHYSPLALYQERWLSQYYPLETYINHIKICPNNEKKIC